MPGRDHRSVGLREHVYTKLLEFTTALQIQVGKRVSMSEAVETLIDKAQADKQDQNTEAN